MSVEVRAIAVVGGELFGLATNGEVIPLRADADAGTPGERAAADDSEEIDRARALLAYQLPVLGDQRGIVPTSAEAPQSPGELARTSEENRRVSVNTLPEVPTHGSARYSYNVKVLSRSSAEVEIYRGQGPGVLLSRVTVSVPEFIGSVEVFAVTDEGDVFLSSESFSLSLEGKLTVTLHLIQFASNGSEVASALLKFPRAGNAGVRPTSQLPNLADDSGTVDIPLVSKHSVSFERVRLEKLQNVPATGVTGAQGSSIQKWLTSEELSLPASRRDVLNRAELFMNIAWRASETNLNSKSPSSCTPPASQWVRPAFLRGVKANEMVYGAPYKWSGKDASDAILKRLQNGAIAGNVCCREYVDPTSKKLVATDEPRAVGVDCSGFVSRAWDLRDKRGREIGAGTADLVNYAGSVKSLDAFLPGDALDKPNDHVRLFAGWVFTPKGLMIRGYESTMDAMCSGVCMRDLPLRLYVGYMPIGFK